MIAKYIKIYQDLLEKIEAKEFASQTYLPSENELMKHYSASRDTIRKSLNQLLQNGYIQKVKGKGSLILDLDKIAFPVSGISSFKELKESMHASNITTIVHQVQYDALDEQAKKDLYMSAGEVCKIVRVREIDHEKVILDLDFLNANYVPGMTEEIAEDSIYEYIEHVLNLKISFSRKEITVVKASEEDKQMLDMKGYDDLVCVKSYTYLDDATLFQYTIAKHRPDKFRFVEFARRM